MVLGTVSKRLDLVRGGQRCSKLCQLRGGIRLESTQIFVMARREAGPSERWPKMLKGELENTSRKPRDLVRKLA
jgi:hypothetical protein